MVEGVELRRRGGSVYVRRSDGIPELRVEVPHDGKEQPRRLGRVAVEPLGDDVAPDQVVTKKLWQKECQLPSFVLFGVALRTITAATLMFPNWLTPEFENKYAGPPVFTCSLPDVVTAVPFATLMLVTVELVRPSTFCAPLMALPHVV